MKRHSLFNPLPAIAETIGREREVEYNERGAMKQDYLGNNRAVINGSAGT